MSFILDALRRADAERSQGQVPGLQTPTVPWPTSAVAGPPSALRRLAPLGATAAVLLVAAAAAWWWWPVAAGDRPVRITQATPLPPPTAAAALPAVATVPTVPAVPTVPTVPTVPAPGLQPPATPGAAASPAPPAPPRAVVQTARATPRTAAPTAVDNLPTLAELPEPLRRQLPPLQLGGLVWAQSPSQRLVLVGGQVFHEGDELQSGLVLQQIDRRAVVFSLQGQRFRVLP